jgi:hypothetical protein
MNEKMTSSIEEPIYNEDGQVIDEKLAHNMAKIENPSQKKEEKKILGIFPRSEKNKKQIIKNGQEKAEKYAEEEKAEIILENDLPEDVKKELKIWKDTYWSSNDLGSLKIQDIKKINLGTSKKIIKYIITGILEKNGTLMPDGDGERYSIPDNNLKIIINVDNDGEITYTPDSDKIPSFDRDAYERKNIPKEGN